MWSQLLDYKPPNSKHQHPEYDAFLNFWGEDTYNNVIDYYLYYTLEDHELIPFKDNKEIMMGEPISKILLGCNWEIEDGEDGDHHFLQSFSRSARKNLFLMHGGRDKSVAHFLPKKKKKCCHVWILVLFWSD